MTPETKYRGAIKLSAIGDALGWMTEFVNSTAELEKRFGVLKIDHFYPWSKQVGGRFNGYTDHICPGAYSDDTQLLLALARSIGPTGEIDNEYFSKLELANWLAYARGGGRTVKNAAKKIQRKTSNWHNNFFSFKAGKKTVKSTDSGANGVAMRILPIALANHLNFSKTHAEVFKNGIITHGHPRAIVGAILYAYCIENALKFRPEDFDRNQFLTLIGKTAKESLALHHANQQEVQGWIKRWERETHSSFEAAYETVVMEAHQGLQNIWKMLHSDFDEIQALRALGCFNPESKSSGIATVLGGIFIVLKYPSKPLIALSKAVNCLGTDTDSIAAFVGGIVGAIHGHHIIPDRWKQVQDWEYLDQVAMDLVKVSFGEQALFERKANTESSNSLGEALLSGEPEVETEVFFPGLGRGTITAVDTQNALTSGKFNVIVDVAFDIGQTCRFSRLLNGVSSGIQNPEHSNLDVSIHKLEASLDPKQKKLFRDILSRLRN